MNISETIKTVLQDKGMSLTELARGMGYTTQYVSDLLSSKRRWNETTLKKVCEVLNLKLMLISNQETTSNNSR